MAATTDKATLEGSQLSKLETNLRRFEEERRKFELERRKFEVERRELDRIRLKRIEERDKKRIAEGYQQLLSIRSSSDKSRKASLKASADPEENQRLIESFNEAQEMSTVPLQEKKIRKSSSKSKKQHLQPPDLVPPSTVVRRSVSLRRRASPRHRNDHSTSDDADDEYATERKGSDGISMQERALANSKFVAEEESLQVEEKKPRSHWFTRLFKKSPPATSRKEEKVAEKKKKTKKTAEKSDKLSKWQLFKEQNQKDVHELRRLTKKCIADTIILAILCGFGGLIFRFTEGAMENFYKCGVKKVKRDFIDQLWTSSHNMRFLFNLFFELHPLCYVTC